MGRVLEIIQSRELEWIRGQIERFSADMLEDYLTKCSAECKSVALSPEHTKNFYDSVWGTIEINQGEIFILDSPILQRLRYIKQLGLANLLYSSADHSRFSHTLGVLQTADVMAGQIQRELRKKGIAEDREVRQIIRLAAIFHDCGHMFCSHASERYFQNTRTSRLYQRVCSVRNAFNDKIGIKPSLSEILSVLIVNSKPVRQLLNIIEKGLVEVSFNGREADESIEKICCLILGIPYSEREVAFSQVISGQIDADKLDYLKRDSHSTGVPVAVDMSRVFQKLRVVAANKKYNMLARHVETSSPVFKMAIAPAAINTVDQLIISRFMMYESVYFHQKTLTAEEMLRYALDRLDVGSRGILDDFSKILRLSDSAVIHETFDKIVGSVIRDYHIVDQESYLKACKILARLYKRRLFKRCAAFTGRNLTKILQNDKDFYKRAILDGVASEQSDFIEAVKTETDQIKSVLDGSHFYYNPETDILLIRTPDTSSASYSNIAIDDKTNKDRDMEFESDNWLKSRASRKPQNYLISYPEDRYIVYIAAEIVLLQKYGLIINDMIIYNEEDEEYINELKEYLNSKNYFTELYFLAPDSYIKSYESKIAELIEKWRKYEIFDVTTGNGKELDTAYLIAHIKQYIQFQDEIGDFDVFLRGYLNLLSQMQVISKETIAGTLRENLLRIMSTEHCEKTDIEICNIGNMQDSSAIISYHMNIVNARLKSEWRVCALEDALERAVAGQRIVFLEDAFCSGRQIVSVFETYMGVPPEKRQTSETHVKELTPESKQRLKQCCLYFSFIYYEKNNADFFKAKMAELGLENVKIIGANTFPVGYFKQEFPEEKKKEICIVRKYMEKAGEMLISWKAHDRSGRRKTNWSDERMENSRLGYNDSQQLVAFSWNTPTYTMTPLWMTVDEDEKKWMPLFPRIDK